MATLALKSFRAYPVLPAKIFNGVYGDGGGELLKSIGAHDTAWKVNDSLMAISNQRTSGC
jgi:hypothetical protein